jgi:hypothetical protein
LADTGRSGKKAKIYGFQMVVFPFNRIQKKRQVNKKFGSRFISGPTRQFSHLPTAGGGS